MFGGFFAIVFETVSRAALAGLLAPPLQWTLKSGDAFSFALLLPRILLTIRGLAVEHCHTRRRNETCRMEAGLNGSPVVGVSAGSAHCRVGEGTED